MPACLLPDRGVVSVYGPDAEAFLDTLLTVSVKHMSEGEARFGALLTPQGKIIVDGSFVKSAEGFLIDCPRILAADFARRLGFYKLRSNVTVVDESHFYSVFAYWADTKPPEHAGLAFKDPRLAALGQRLIASNTSLAPAEGSAKSYERHRIELGVPDGLRDFTYGDAFPHEADMDQLHGIDFHKGCYVGQEVVSRMQHRGIARTRIVPVMFNGGIPPANGSDAVAGGKVIGHIGSTTETGQALALLRLDRVADAMAEGQQLTAGGISFKLERRDWMNLDFPEGL
jgi:folate-binding protein YgfZ